LEFCLFFNDFLLELKYLFLKLAILIIFASLHFDS
jgi:hypothetical protein